MCWRGRRTSSIASNDGKESGFSLGRHNASSGFTYDPSEEVAREIRSVVGEHHLLLLTDFDGTLAELAPTPAEARMSEDVRLAITGLTQLRNVTVGVVSGRRLADVAGRVAGEAFVAGLHGLEIVGPGSEMHHPSLPVVRPIIAEVTTTARSEMAWCPGLYLEDKVYALTCHVRLVSAELVGRALEQFSSLAAPHLHSGVLRALNGAKALELLPNVDWNKGRAATWIRDRVAETVGRPVSTVYLGDDRTDEDAFAAMGDQDVAIGVGDRPHDHMIDCRLSGPASVGRLFEHLARL